MISPASWAGCKSQIHPNGQTAWSWRGEFREKGIQQALDPQPPLHIRVYLCPISLSSLPAPALFQTQLPCQPLSGAQPHAA